MDFASAMWRIPILICLFAQGFTSQTTSANPSETSPQVTTTSPIITTSLETTTTPTSTTQSSLTETLSANQLSTIIATTPINQNISFPQSSTSVGIPSSTSSSLVPSSAGISVTGTEKPAARGEYESKVGMNCRYTEETFNPNYRKKNSKEYTDFTNKVFINMKVALLLKLLRLIEIIFNSLDEGSVIADMTFVMASNSSMAGTSLSALVIDAAINATNGAITVNKITVLQSPTLVPDTTITSTLSTISTTYQMVTGTEKPAARGEYESKVGMNCRYTDETFNPHYKNKNSKEYADFTNKAFINMKMALLLKLLRLIEIIFNSLDEGSVIVDMQLVMASNSSMAGTNLSALVMDAAINATNGAITFNKITVLKSPTLVPDTTTTTPSFPEWGIVVIVFAPVIIVLILTVITVKMVKISQNKAKKRFMEFENKE